MSNQSVPNNANSNSPISSRLPLFIIISILLVLIVYLQWPETKKEKSQYNRVVSVKMTPVLLAEFIESVEALGTARANEQVVITSKYSDLVDEVYFDDGQFVKKGAPLIRLNNQEELAKVNELTANLSESQAHLKRLTELLASRATSQSLVEQQAAQTKAIEAQLASAKARLSDLTIRAPFSGVLGFRQVSKGAYVDAGKTITSLDDSSLIKVDFHLPERLLTHINVGQQISAKNTAYKSKEFIGKITAIDSRIDSNTRTIKVRASINNENQKLHPGMLLNISVLLQVENILQLPESSIIPIEGSHYVFTEKEGKAFRKVIEIGRRQPGVVEVISGLNEGEQVVVEGALKLRDGATVSIIEPKQKASEVESNNGVQH
ncbi:efflux RND transporter periplasmic adaptor subunit [Colwelliaceae bacterium MEBiC 14330]